MAKILLVEDDSFFHTIFHHNLNSEHDIDVALNLDMAKKYLNSTKYDIVITDCCFPENKTKNFSDSKEENRGKIVAALAMEKGIPVIGVANDERGLKDYCDFVFSKKKLIISDLKDAIIVCMKKIHEKELV